MRVSHSSLIACVVWLSVAPTQAQELPTTPRLIKSTSIEGTIGAGKLTDLSTLSDAYVKGDWASVTANATALLAKVQTDCTTCFELGRDYVHLLWVGSIPTSSDPVLFSVLMHDPAVPPYSRVLPGVVNDRTPYLVEVFISDNEDARVGSYYISKPLPDPLLEQVPSVVDKFLGPLFGLFDRVSPTDVDVMVAGVPTPKLKVIVGRVALPESRAGVEVTVRASLPITKAELGESIDGLESRLRREGLAGSPTLQATLNSVRIGLSAVPGSPACQPPSGTLKTCKASLHEAISAVVDPARNNTPADPARRDLDRLEFALRAFVEELKPTVVTGKFSLDNSPLTHLSFGLLTSFALNSWGSDLRAAVDGGKVVNAPLPRALQMVVLNISPRGYQSKTTGRWSADSFFRPFVGVVFAPDIGVAGGASFMVLSNLGVNIGYARLFISRPEDGLDFGAVLDEKLKGPDGKETAEFRYSSQLRSDPLQRGGLHALFLGVSYNFK